MLKERPGYEEITMELAPVPGQGILGLQYPRGRIDPPQSDGREVPGGGGTHEPVASNDVSLQVPRVEGEAAPQECPQQGPGLLHALGNSGWDRSRVWRRVGRWRGSARGLLCLSSLDRRGYVGYVQRGLVPGPSVEAGARVSSANETAARQGQGSQHEKDRKSRKC